MTEAQHPGDQAEVSQPDPAAPPEEKAPEKKPLDKNTDKFRQTWNDGKESGRKAFASELESKLGTSDLGLIAEMITVAKEQQTTGKTQNEELQARVQTLEAEKAQITEQQVKTSLENSVISSFENLRLSPKKTSTALNEFLGEHEIKDGKVYPKGSEVPVTDGQGGLASIQQSIQQWSGKPENGFLFDRPGGGHLEVNPGSNSNELPEGFLRNPQNVEALRRTGELGKAMSGQAVNMAKVNAELKTQQAQKAAAHLQILQQG